MSVPFLTVVLFYMMLFFSDGVMCSGYLLKLGGTGITPKNWRKRWYKMIC